MARTLNLRYSSLLFQVKAPIVKKRWLWWCSGSLGKNDLPFLFVVIEQAVEVNVVHVGNSDHCCLPGKAPLAFQSPLHDHE